VEVIRCEGLTKRYGETVAVDGLSLTVTGGQVFGFLGPNGSGKTTTMRMLLGLIEPTAGQAWLNERTLPDPDGLSSIGAMIEEPAFYPWMTGRKNLAVLALCGPPLAHHDAIEVVLDRVALEAVADRKVNTYSQGMRQRLGLAAALLRTPKLLLLDEPTNGMDPAGIREFRDLLRTLAGEGTTVFLSSHLLAEVEQVCDRVAVLNHGRLIEEGRVRELTSTRVRVRVVLEEADQTPARTLLAAWPMTTDGPNALLIDGARGRDVSEVLGRAGVWAHEIRVEHADLEEAFLHLTADDQPDTASSSEEWEAPGATPTR
jgi:ABC-2 type transport system ATP-binding protein